MVWRPFIRHLTQSSVRLNDQCGRLNSTWTVGILVLFAVLTFFIQIPYDDAVSCWTPTDFTYALIVYTNKICSHSGVHYLPVTKDIPNMGHTGRDALQFKWRWLPLILLVQALLFKLPDIVLSVGQGLLGFRFTKISGLTDGYETLNMADRTIMGRQVGRHLKSWIDSTVSKGCPWGWLTLLILFTKLLYFINIITQLSVMDGILKSDNQSSFGRQMFDNIIGGNQSEFHTFDSPFSRITLCSFQINQLQALQRWTVQCIHNNIAYYEMIMCFLWLWFVVVSVITTTSGLVQSLTVIMPVFRNRYIKSYLYMSKEVSPSPSDNDIGRFAGSEITEDGVFVLKAIGEASSEHLVRDAVIYLWHSTHDQHSSVPQGPSEHVGPPSYLPGSLVPGQAYGPGDTTSPTRYRTQTGTETVPLPANQPK
ncbi:innexin unc-7-like [Pecten maximus]|uniref:innexin unc-7-like n=1 Tax=Pecten maximus TaxID=6579 RepID=UPI001458D195|nr:innexin unc-7-like [Pecten maximus]